VPVRRGGKGAAAAYEQGGAGGLGPECELLPQPAKSVPRAQVLPALQRRATVGVALPRLLPKHFVRLEGNVLIICETHKSEGGPP
jgi:hypothetical protein